MGVRAGNGLLVGELAQSLEAVHLPAAVVDVDAALVERVQRGDQRAFEMLVVKYQRRIERLIARMVRDVDLAGHCSGNFIRAYRALPNFRGECVLHLVLSYRGEHREKALLKPSNVTRW